jgi:hypothetical protein
VQVSKPAVPVTTRSSVNFGFSLNGGLSVSLEIRDGYWRKPFPSLKAPCRPVFCIYEQAAMTYAGQLDSTSDSNEAAINCPVLGAFGHLVNILHRPINIV